MRDLSLGSNETPQSLKSLDAFRLTKAFWEQFSKAQWERIPTVVRQPFATPIITTTEIFEGCVAASERYREETRTVQLPTDRIHRIRLYEGHSLVVSDIGTMLPKLSNGSLDGYRSAINAQLKGRSYELIINKFHLYTPVTFLRLRAFCSDLFEQVGLPNRHVDVGLFLREQETTSFGIHRDTASVFLFVLEGRKRLVFWPRDYRDGRDILATRQIERFRHDGVTLTGEAGDLIYWPSSFWHVGESTGTNSISLNLGFLVDHPPWENLFTEWTKLATNSLRNADFEPLHDWIGANDASRVADFDQLLGRLSTLFGEQTERTRQALQLWRLSRMSAGGFRGVPEPLGQISPLNRGLAGHSAFPVALTEWGSGETLCIANGHSFYVTCRRTLAEKIINAVNSGEKLTASDYIRVCGCTPEEVGGLLAMLSKLYQLRVLFAAD